MIWSFSNLDSPLFCRTVLQLGVCGCMYKAYEKQYLGFEKNIAGHIIQTPLMMRIPAPLFSKRRSASLKYFPPGKLKTSQGKPFHPSLTLHSLVVRKFGQKMLTSWKPSKDSADQEKLKRNHRIRNGLRRGIKDDFFNKVEKPWGSSCCGKQRDEVPGRAYSSGFQVSCKTINRTWMDDTWVHIGILERVTFEPSPMNKIKFGLGFGFVMWKNQMSRMSNNHWSRRAIGWTVI